MTYRCLFLILSLLFSAKAADADDADVTGEAPAPIQLSDVDLESHVDQFDGGFELEWDILREERDAYSLETAPGELTVQTLYGSIVKTYGDNVKNMFLIKEPITPGDPFEMTVFVTQFEPTQPYQQIALLAYQDDAHFLKFSYEHHGSRKGTGVHRCLEVEDDVTFHGISLEFDGPFWLRMTREGTTYQLAYSDDGEDYQTVETVTWDSDAKDGDLKVGFVAKNGTTSANSAPVTIEYFQLMRPPGEAGMTGE